MTTIYANYGLPPTRAIFKRRTAKASVVTRSIVASIFVLGGLASAVADDGKRADNRFEITSAITAAHAPLESSSTP
jgi:hypothetical protein